MAKVELNNLSAKEKLALLEELKAEEKAAKIENARAYDGLKSEFLARLFATTEKQESEVAMFFEYIKTESEAFIDVMADYGKLKKKAQRSFSIVDDHYKLEVKSTKVKRFDERANVAAERLIDFLKEYIAGKDQGADDPMYQLAMNLVRRNENGDLDIKQISQLYKLEEQFNNSEYSEIMGIFRESHIVDTTTTHYYFFKKDENKVWKRIELSFNKL